MRSPMKTFKQTVILTALVLGGIYTLLAQSPGVPYQAYIVDANKVYVPGEQLENVPLANTDIMLQFEIKDSKGAVEYIEQIPLTTDKYGMVHTIVGVGNGTPIIGKFRDIKWDGKPKTMGIDIDFTGKGNQFQPHGTMDLVYVPGPGNGGFPESVTTFVDNGDNTYTYTSEDGTKTHMRVPTKHGNGNPNGNGTTGQAGDIYVDDSTGDVYTYNNITNTWMPHGGNTVTTAATAPSGASEGDIWFDTTSGVTFVYDADSSQWLALDDQAATEVVVTDGTVDIDGDGTPDNNVTVQEALENLDKIVQATETTSTLTDNKNGTYTYTDEDGTKTTFDVPQSGSGNPNTNSVPGTSGDIYIDDSTGDVYTYDGSTWVVQSGGDVTSAATAPSGASEGDIWFDTTNGGTFVYDADSSQWLALDDQAATEVALTDGTVDIDGDGTPDNNGGIFLIDPYIDGVEISESVLITKKVSSYLLTPNETTIGIHIGKSHNEHLIDQNGNDVDALVWFIDTHGDTYTPTVNNGEYNQKIKLKRNTNTSGFLQYVAGVWKNYYPIKKAIASYNHEYYGEEFTSYDDFKGIGVTSVADRLVNTDANVTETTKATVDAYTEIDNLDKLYDRAKSWKVDSANVEHPSIGALLATADGTTLDLDDHDLVIDASAASAFAVDKTNKKITIKANTLEAGTRFTAIKTTGTISMANSATLEFGYEDSTGINKFVHLDWGDNVAQDVSVENLDDNSKIVDGVSATKTYKGHFLMPSPAPTAGIQVQVDTPSGFRVYQETFPEADLNFIRTDVTLTASEERQIEMLFLARKILQKSEGISEAVNGTTPTTNYSITTTNTTAAATNENQVAILQLLRRVLNKVSANREALQKE